jgi:hypothetical protein
LHDQWGEKIAATCHSAILCRYSQVLKRLFEHYTLEGQTISCIEFSAGVAPNMWGFLKSEEGSLKSGIGMLTQWCYTGRFGPVGYDYEFTSDHDLESMWNFAVDLEMPLLANYCMRLIVAKYSYGCWATEDYRPVLLLSDAPYHVLGPIYVFSPQQAQLSTQKAITVRGGPDSSPRTAFQ